MFGEDFQKEVVVARDRVSYLPGELSLYENVIACQFFRMYFYLQKSNADPRYWQTLTVWLDLDISHKIREFSRGNMQKVGVVAGFMDKPDLLILCEPTSGLDPLIQQTVMDLVCKANETGTTVFISSHILSEVQTVCDRVGILRSRSQLELPVPFPNLGEGCLF